MSAKKAYIATNFIGSFAFDHAGSLLHYKLFEKNPEFIAARMIQAKRACIDEEKELVYELKNSGYTEFVFDRNVSVDDLKCLAEPDHVGIKKLKQEFRKYAVDFQWADSNTELNNLMTKVNVMITKGKISEVGRDKIIIQVIGIVDELDDTINTLSERMREWYGLHFPESLRAIKSHEKFAEIVKTHGHRDKIEDKNLAKIAEKSAGMHFNEKDMESIKKYSSAVLELYDTRQRLSNYLSELTKENIPNLSAITGPLLASRLVALAGGLEKMVKMPSSTIQLLGAEKALFRHLKGQGKPPKYGALFAHPYIQNAPKDQRGKIARLLASKISLAAKMDFFSKEDRSDELKKDLEEKMKEIKK